ncbi:triacylglycerol lipase [Marinobacter halodurans]|uniref:Triacylglycerol lipase n=1 Tax=Marinobacter halodurans TaxID=2528979 RepID=A0ABY1ZRN4_9GAMM|nr:triacylglycerol lipase [Marinobacter halodurans]TBW57632.1 triacylglycerol lipase [Marinobacter halodurans]
MPYITKVRTAVAATALSLGLAVAQPASAGLFDSLFGNDDYTKTQYPIVLVHGFAGFDELFGFVEYFNGIPDALADGGADVYVVQMSASNSTEVRGEQLLAQVEEIVAATGAEKVNLIGHSHGGPTSRYVAGVRPDLVASVSTVGGVNWGSVLADQMVEDDTFSSAGDYLFELLDMASGGGLPQDTDAALNSLTTDYAVAFNKTFPGGVPSTYCGDDGAHEANGVRYYSWGGNVVETNSWDPSDWLLAETGAAFGEPNDGLVSACSQKLGQVISVEYHHNHLDEINQVFGLTARNVADPVELYRQQANRLKQAGL